MQSLEISSQYFFCVCESVCAVFNLLVYERMQNDGFSWGTKLLLNYHVKLTALEKNTVMITVIEAIDDYLEITSLQIVSCCGT